MSGLARRRDELTRAAGVLILVSIVFWWIALRAWAEAQVGYLDVDALGVTPFVWVALLGISGLAMVTRALPRPEDTAANVVCTGFFLIGGGALGAVNLAYGADDGISAAGWLLAAFSLAQASVLVAAMLLAGVRAVSRRRTRQLPPWFALAGPRPLDRPNPRSAVGSQPSIGTISPG